jgi:hypothetical protein
LLAELDKALFILLDFQGGLLPVVRDHSGFEIARQLLELAGGLCGERQFCFVAFPERYSLSVITQN